MNNKKETTLGNITVIIFDGKHGDCEDEPNTGYYFVSVKDLKEYDIDYSKARQITENDFVQNYKRTNLENGDTVYANTGDTIGESIFVKDNPLVKNTSFQKSVAILKPNVNYVEPRYLYYLLKFETPRLRSASTGSGQKNLLLSTMRSFELSIHDKRNQKKIIAVLGSIDDKIRCNNQINDNLQQQLKLMYDYWFTQFDYPNNEGKPYRSSGGTMHWNEELKRDIPDGWTVKSLGEILHKNKESFDYKTIQPAIDLSVMPSDTIALSQLNSSENFNTNLFVMKQGDILFGSIRPYLHKAGFAPIDGVVAGTVRSYSVKNPTDYNFALFTLCRRAFFDYAVNVSSGTKMPVISSDSLLSYKLPYSEEIAAAFNKVDIVDIISQNIQETIRLNNLRDFLLPMLMNGQATISD